ncbi:MAG: PAS domain S-box-containing protein, partial [Sulfurimonas sp.]|uniref:PAS domain-containing protein n=1 Tax=Sulfurimonas sp. TaxID=2022749 RepID=UPI0039E6D60B
MKKEEYERLRNLALDKLENSSANIPENHLNKGMDELIQINEIYQAELEAQNDELQTNIFNLEEAQSELEILFTHAPIPYMLLTKKFNVTRANKEALRMFNSKTFLSKNIPFYTHLYKGEMTKFLDWIHNKNEFHPSLEVLLHTKVGFRYCILHYHKWSTDDSDTFLLSIIDVHSKKEKDDRFKALFDNTQQGVVCLNADNSIVDLNSTALKIIGKKEAECIGNQLSYFNWTFVGEDGEIVSLDELPFAKTAQKKESTGPFVFAIKRPQNNNIIWLKIESIPHFSPKNQEIIGVFYIFTDVSKEYILTKELNQQLENFKLLGNNIPDVIIRINDKKEILFINKKGEEFFNLNINYRKNIDLCSYPIFKTQQAENICSIFNDLNKLDDPITYSLSYKINRVNKNYFIRIIPEISKDIKKLFLIIIEDITERIESEDMFNQLFYNASDAIVLTDHSTGKVKSINSKARKLLDVNPESLEEYSSIDALESFQSKELTDKHIDTLDNQGQDSYEVIRILDDNTKQYLKIYSTLIDIGDEVYHQSIIHDLTEHKLLELQLKQSSKVFEHTTEGILITALDGSIISANDGFLKITGYS